MRYFRIYDEISEEGGDLYRWDGKELVYKSPNGWSDWSDSPGVLGKVEALLDHLSGPKGYWEEVEGE